MTWSKLVHTQIGRKAFARMTNPLLMYHNRNHVFRLYDLASLWSLPYDPELDLAILYHDCVYDAKPLKELRSADALMRDARSNPAMYESYDITRACARILNTAGHIWVSDVDPAMIMLDVADLADPTQRILNFNLIMLESQALYGITEVKAAEETVKFMDDFKNTVNANASKDEKNSSFWKNVAAGCEATQYMAKKILTQS